MTSDHLTLALVTGATWVVVAASYAFAARRDGRTPADDLGILWLVVMALYATLPPIAWLAQGASYGPDGNARLFVLQPTSADVLAMLEIGLAYVCAFALAFAIGRRRVSSAAAGVARYTRIDDGKMRAAVGVVLVFKLTMIALGAVGYLRGSSSYMDSYVSIQELPVLARQAVKIGSGIAAVAQLVFLIALLQRWPRHRILLPIYIAALLLSFDPEGARTALVTGLLAVAIAWHVLVQPIAARWWIAGVVAGLVVFLALGARRGFAGGGEGALLSYDLGEFDSLWANGLELADHKAHGWTDLPWTTRFGELWAFIPSQLLPFEKSSMSTWFVDTFYRDYSEQGGGWAFGAIAQAVIGGGLVEAVIRGGILGAIAARTLRWFRADHGAWWRLPLYLHLMILTYQSVRDTTFSALGDMVQITLPALVLIAILGKLGARPEASA